MSRLILAFVASLAAIGAAHAEITLTHVHGLSYSAEGKRVMIPSHHGLAVYEDGIWAKAPGPQHDYMGFAASAKNLYSSGHPAPGSGLVNPFGLLRSRDGGRSWDKLGLEGESDFHLLATSWNTNAIYVWNSAPNSRMKQPGLHLTLNEGFGWKSARGSRVEGAPHALAVHPDDPKSVAVATSKGIFESNDSGETFDQIAGGEGTAVFYDLDGKHLWYGYFEREPRLARARLRTGPMAQIKLPPLKQDAVAYIAQNPAKRAQYAIATFRRSVYLSEDAGKSWKQIADRGAAK
jgi:hypothetical protein